MRSAYPRRHIQVATEKDYAAKNARNKEKFDRISLMVPKGQKDVIKQYCKEHHETVNGMMNRLLKNEIEGFEPTDTGKMYGADKI